jgi:hypothetical protein
MMTRGEAEFLSLHKARHNNNSNADHRIIEAGNTKHYSQFQKYISDKTILRVMV